MNDFLAWYFTQLAAHPLIGIAVQAVLIGAFCYGLAALLERHDDRREARHELRAGLRAAERHANHPANRQRKEKP